MITNASMRQLAILGAGGHGKVVADTAECCGWSEIQFFDDGWPARQHNGSWRIAGDTAALLATLDSFDGVLVAVGNNSFRLAMLQRLQAAGATLPVLIHPAATISRHAGIGAGSVVFAGAVVNPGASIGMGAILNTGCSVDHDCQLGDGVHVSPGARLAGNVQVGDLGWIGVGSCVRQQIRIGCSVTVGAGAAVVCDIADGLTVMGVPARPRQAAD